MDAMDGEDDGLYGHEANQRPSALWLSRNGAGSRSKVFIFNP